MESIIALLASGVAIGVIISDWRARNDVLSRVKLREQSLIDMIEALQKTHNQLTQGFQHLESQVATHEYLLKGGSRGPKA